MKVKRMSIHREGDAFRQAPQLFSFKLVARGWSSIRMKDSIYVSKENYLKAILEAEAEGHQVIPATLAHWLEVSAPAVTMALKRLKRDGFVRGGRRRHRPSYACRPRDRLPHRPAPPPHRAHVERDLRHGVVRNPRRGRAPGARRLARLRGQAQGKTRRDRLLPAWQLSAPREPGQRKKRGETPPLRGRRGQALQRRSASRSAIQGCCFFLHHTGIGPGKNLRVVSQNYDQTVSIELSTGNSILGRPAAEAVWLRPENSS